MKKILQISLLLLSFGLLQSQDQDKADIAGDYFIDYRALPNNDTLKVTRWQGDWWFGPAVTLSGQQYFGSFFLPRNVNFGAVDPNFNPEFEIPGSLNTGTEFGLIAEWNPEKQDHVGFIRVSYLSRHFESVSDVLPNSDPEEVLRPLIDLNYLDVSLNYKYKFDFLNSFVYGGPNIELLLSQSSRYRVEFVNTGDIQEWRKLELDNPNTRFGFNLGFGFDIFMLAFENSRLKFNPFIEADFGTSTFENQDLQGSSESTMNVAQAKIGVSLKWGQDKISIDTLRFDPTFKGPVLATSDINFDVDIDKYLTQQSLKSEDLAYIPLPEPIEKVREEPEIQRPSTTTEEPLAEKPKVDVVPNRVKNHLYKTSSQTGFTEELETYLNSVAEFMKENPYSEIRVIGHSDNLGTPEQNQRRSERRADRVVKYLLSKGIDRYRILARGEGARRPIADTKTPEGRAKNRRVEITVVQ